MRIEQLQAYIAQGQYESACEILRAQLRVSNRLTRPIRLPPISTTIWLGGTKTERGEDALQSVQTAIARLPADHADQALFRTLQGSVLAELGKNFDSRRLFLMRWRDVKRHAALV